MDNIVGTQDKILHLLHAYERGELGDQTMPEDTHPRFLDNEQKLAFFTLPMALNYQRNSYKLWQAATETFLDSNTKAVFDVGFVANSGTESLRKMLTKHKLALQPNNHIAIWQRISQTITENWKTISGLLKAADSDFVKLQQIMQKEYKKQFPYLSGPKIFHYWCKILGDYCDVDLKNRDLIQIAPDTHVIQCAVKLGILSEKETETFSRDKISDRFREVLVGIDIAPIDLHAPLWFWSRNDFKYKINNDQ